MPNAPVPAAAPGLPIYDLDDLEFDIGRLGHLLAVTTDILTEMPHVQDGQRLHDVDRAEALASLACELAKRVSGALVTMREQAGREQAVRS